MKQFSVFVLKELMTNFSMIQDSMKTLKRLQDQQNLQSQLQQQQREYKQQMQQLQPLRQLPHRLWVYSGQFVRSKGNNILKTPGQMAPEFSTILRIVFLRDQLESALLILKLANLRQRFIHLKPKLAKNLLLYSLLILAQQDAARPIALSLHV